MKKITFLLFALMIGFITMQSQTISLIGDAVGGWSTDVDLTTTDNNIYTLTGYTIVSGGVKFRQNHDWGTNWGGTAFPSGTAVLNSADNIPAIAGTYDITFNLTTLTYNFVSTTNFANIGIIGSAVNGGATTDTNLFTTDGVNYFIKAINLSDGNAHFRQDDSETINWSDSAFPSGTGTQNGTDIPVTANDYNIDFNITTGAYSFNFLDISLIGQFNSWGADVDLTTADGENYTLNGFILPDTAPNPNELKFRQNHDWSVNWGDGGGNITLTPGTYNVTFTRSTGAYTFTSTTASIKDYATSNDIIIYPTATNTYFKSNKSIHTIKIYTITGSIAKTFTGNFAAGYAFNISDLSPAMYFISIDTKKGNGFQRLIVK